MKFPRAGEKVPPNQPPESVMILVKEYRLFDGKMDVTPFGDMLFAAASMLHIPDASPRKHTGQSKENVADKALKNVYNLFSIEHILQDRFNPCSHPSYSRFSPQV